MRRFGGFVAKYLGDGVLIYFGYPQAHEGDAARGVRAGLELVEAVARSRLLCLYRPVSASRLGWLSLARVAGSKAENVIKIRKGGQVRCNLVGLTDMITHDDLRSTIARHIEEARRMVTEQKGRIARLKATGVDTALAELTLRALEANLKRFQNHSDWSELCCGRLPRAKRALKTRNARDGWHLEIPAVQLKIRQSRLGFPANDSPRRTARCFAAGPAMTGTVARSA